MSSIQQVLSPNYGGSSAATSAYYGSSDFYSTLKLQPGPSANYNQVHLNTEYSRTDESTRSFSPLEIGTRNNPQHSDTCNFHLFYLSSQVLILFFWFSDS